MARKGVPGGRVWLIGHQYNDQTKKQLMCACFFSPEPLQKMKPLLFLICSPMDFLITPYHRWIYVAIFGVMAFNLFSVYLEVKADNIFLWLFFNLSKDI